MFRISVDPGDKRFVALTVLAGISLVAVGSWQAWKWVRRSRVSGEPPSDQSPTDIRVVDERNEQSESRSITGKQHSTRHDHHGHHHDHHHHQHAETLGSTLHAGHSTHGSDAHGETERLLHTRSQTEPNYSGTSRHRPEGSKHSDLILPFHETHDEPVSMFHADDQTEEARQRHGRFSLSGNRNGGSSHGTNGLSSRSVDNNHGNSISTDDFREILQRNISRILEELHTSEVPDQLRSLPDDAPGKRYRGLAREEARLRKDAFERSKRAFKSGQKAEAKRLSDQGKLHDENSRRYNALAAGEIFAANNPRYQAGRQLTRCDLHGLHVEEAMGYARDHLMLCREARADKTMLIVGKGAHSQQGGARIKPAIMAMLRGTGGIIAGVHEKNEGCIVVDFAVAS